MINLLNSVKARPRFFVRATLCISVLFVLSEAAAVARSLSGFTGNADLHMSWLYLTFYASMMAAAYTLIVVAIYTKGQVEAAKITAVYAVCRLVGEIVEFFLDCRTTELKGMSASDRILLAVAHISELFAVVSLAFGVWIMAVAFLRLYRTHEGRRKYAVRSAVNFAILFEFVVSIARFIVRSGIGIFQSDTPPSVDAIRDLIYQSLETVVFFAIIAFIASRIVMLICTEREF